MNGSMPAFDRLKGFRDFLPGEMEARRDVFQRLEEVVRRYGFREIDLPALESLDLFLVKSGEELVEQTFSFEDKGGRDVTLIPEQTPSRARIVAQNKALSKPAKWYSQSKRWRYEAPQKGRLREFYQMDVDIFGTDSVDADAEILAVAVDLMDALDVLDSVEVLVNDRQLLEAVLEAHGVDAKQDVLQVIDDKEKMDAETFRTELEAAGLTENQAASVDDLTGVRGPLTDALNQVAELAPDTQEATQAVERLDALRGALEAYGVAEHIVVDLSIVRGLAYYTGLVFEVFDVQGDLRAVCGGGRYDSLVELFGGETVPAVGFAVGDAVIEELMRREGVWPGEAVETDVYVLIIPSEGEVDPQREGLEIATALREHGLVVETDVQGRSVGDQFGYADRVNAETVVVVGVRDLEQGVVTVQDMESGEEEQVDRETVVEQLTTDR